MKSLKSFENWTFEDVQDILGLKRNFDSDVLKEWLSAKKTMNEIQKIEIDRFKNKLLRYVDTWNEDELKLQFIGPFLDVVDFNTDKYKAFSQRVLSMKTDKIEVSGRVDYLVATGLMKPRQPFFFFHEYKPARRGVNDPLGQLLIEMITGKTLNNLHFPIYGCFVEGQIWRFVVITPTYYALSNTYDAVTDEIYDIFAILCKVKDYIDEILK